MGLFNRFKKNNRSGSDNALSAEKADAVIKIAEAVSCGDPDLMNKVRELARDPQKYFEAHRDDYMERGIEACPAPTEIVRLGMTDILERHNYVCERDYKDEKEDFIYFLSSLVVVKQNALPINEELLDEDDNISEWCAAIDPEWEKAGYCVGCIDIVSDSYVLFPAEIAEIDRLDHLAELVGCRIKYAKNS